MFNKSLNIILLPYFQKFTPEILLLFCILLLIIYKYLFKERFSYLYSIFFLVYSLVILSIVIYLLIQMLFSDSICNKDTDLFIINSKVCVAKIVIIAISIICLLFFRYSLTNSQTNCLGYFILYLSTIFICLMALSINFSNLAFTFLSLELVITCFYILSSFNFNNFGYLLFRFIHVRKLLYFSSLLSLIGLLIFYGHYQLENLALINDFKNLNYFLSILLVHKQYLLVSSIVFLLLSLILKMVIFHSPTHYIYYQKTPIITIMFMHLTPKILFFYLIIELIFTNYYFSICKHYINLVLLISSIICLIISIGMRRLFLKHYIEYISLVNSGYLLLCLSPLTSTSLNYSIYFLLYYILILLFYGSIFSFFDNIENPGKRISFDTIFFEIEKKDYLSIILSIFLFFLLGLPPTRRDYPCSRGIPFNGFLLQWLVLNSLLDGQLYWISFFLIIFNLILFLFFFWTIVPFWYENKKFISSVLPKYLTSELIEYILLYLIFFLLILQVDINFLIINYIKTLHIL